MSAGGGMSARDDAGSSGGVRMDGAPRLETAPVRLRPKAPIAFFDFDHTLIDADAGPLFGWYLFKERRHGLVGHPWRRMRMWIRYVPFFTWMGVQGALYALHAVRRSTIVRGAYRGLKGVSVSEFTGLLQNYADEALVPRIYPSMRRVIQEHLAAGRQCMVITTGMDVLIRPVLDAIDPRIGLIGCRLHAKDGRLTGDVDGPLFGKDKANILHAVCRALDVETSECWAYSDHYSDKDMLEAVGHGVVVNGRGRFVRLARKRGWQLLHPKRDDGPAA